MAQGWILSPHASRGNPFAHSHAPRMSSVSRSFRLLLEAASLGWTESLFLTCSPALVCLHSLAPCGQVVEGALSRCVVVTRRVRPARVVKRHVCLSPARRLADAVVACRYPSSYVTRFQRRAPQTVSRQQPVPSRLMWRRCSFSPRVPSRLVNGPPGSVWKMAGGAFPGQGLLDRLQAEGGGQRMGQRPRPYPPTRPIQDGAQRHNAALPRDIGEVRGPDVMRARDLQLAQPSGIDRVGWRPRAGAGRAIQGMDPPPRHPRGHRPSSHWLALHA